MSQVCWPIHPRHLCNHPHVPSLRPPPKKIHGRARWLHPGAQTPKLGPRGLVPDLVLRATAFSILLAVVAALLPGAFSDSTLYYVIDQHRGLARGASCVRIIWRARPMGADVSISFDSSTLLFIDGRGLVNVGFCPLVRLLRLSGSSMFDLNHAMSPITAVRAHGGYIVRRRVVSTQQYPAPTMAC